MTLWRTVRQDSAAQGPIPSVNRILWFYGIKDSMKRRLVDFMFCFLLELSCQMYSFINGVLPITFSMMIRLPAFFFQGTQKIKKMDAFTTYIKAIFLLSDCKKSQILLKTIWKIELPSYWNCKKLTSHAYHLTDFYITWK